VANAPRGSSRVRTAQPYRAIPENDFMGWAAMGAAQIGGIGDRVTLECVGIRD